LLLGSDAQHELEHFFEYFRRQPFARVGQTRMVGRVLVQRRAQKLAQRKAVGTPPGDTTLAANSFEVTHKQHAKVDAWRNAGLAAFLFLSVVRLTPLLDPRIDIRLGQQACQLPIERVPRGPRQLVRRDEERLLPLLLPLAHCHGCSPSSHVSARSRSMAERLPCLSLLQRAASPIPSPPCDRLSVPSDCVNRSKTRGSISGAM